MQNIVLLQRKNVDLNYKIIFWMPQKYIETLYNSTIPKLITYINSDEITNLENYFKQNNPYKHLNYVNEETYLMSKNLTKNIVIKNTITHIINYIDNNELQDLVQYFIPLVKNKKIKIMNANQSDEKAIYNEIVSYLNYMQKIKTLLVKNTQDNRGDKFGTGFRKSSLKKIVEIKINMLEDRLNEHHFPITNNEEIKKINSIIKMLKKSQEDDYKNFFEYSHIINNLVGLNLDTLDLNEIEKESLKQSISFHNGIRCSDAELVRSSIIFLNMLFFNKLNNENQYIDSILDITTQFFNEEMSEINREKNQLTFTKSHIEKSYALKTTLDETSIFIYSTKESPLEELLDIAFKSMAGLENKFEPNNLPLDSLTEEEIMERILETLQNELQLDEEDIQIFRYFFTLLEKGKIPLPHFVQ